MDLADIQAIEKSSADLIRELQFDDAETLLIDALSSGDPRFYEICRNSNRGDLRIEGWPQLYADIESLERRGEKVAAIGIDLTMHNEDKDIVFECNYYDEGYFPFSTARREEILPVCGYGAPWQGCFVDIASPLTLYGLAPLHMALRTYEHRSYWPSPNAPLPEAYGSYELATWFLILRVHRALCDALGAQGLPKPMPVIVGEHDFGPNFASVYMVEKVRADSESAERVIAQRQAETQAQFDRITDETIERLRTYRETVLSWPFYVDPLRRRAYVDLAVANQNVMLKMVDMSIDRPTWKMSNDEFEMLLMRYRTERAKASA